MLESNLMGFLYSRRASAEITVKVLDESVKKRLGEIVCLNVELVGLDGKPSCSIRHLERGFYVRTLKGFKREKYMSIGTLVRACGVKLRNLRMQPLEFRVIISDCLAYKYTYIEYKKKVAGSEKGN